MRRVEGTSPTFLPVSPGVRQARIPPELSRSDASAEQHQSGSTREESTFLGRFLRALAHRRPRHPALAQLDATETSPAFNLFCRDLKDEAHQIAGSFGGQSSPEQDSVALSPQRKSRKRDGKKAARRRGSSMEVDETAWSTVTVEQSYLQHVRSHKPAPPGAGHSWEEPEQGRGCQTDGIFGACYMTWSPPRQGSIPSVRMRSPTSSSFAMSVDIPCPKTTRRSSTQMSIDDIVGPSHSEQLMYTVNHTSHFIPSLGQQAELFWRRDNGPQNLAPTPPVNVVEEANRITTAPSACTETAPLKQEERIPSPPGHTTHHTDRSPPPLHTNHQRKFYLPTGRGLLEKIPVTIKDFISRATTHNGDEKQTAISTSETPAEPSRSRPTQPVGIPPPKLPDSSVAIPNDHITVSKSTIDEPREIKRLQSQPRQDYEPSSLLLAPSSPPVEPSDGTPKQSELISRPPPIKRIPAPSFLSGEKMSAKRRRSDSPSSSDREDQGQGDGQSDGQTGGRNEGHVDRYKRARRSRALSDPEAGRITRAVQPPTPPLRLSSVAEILPFLPPPFEEPSQQAERPRQRKRLAAEHRAQRAAGDYKAASKNRRKARQARASSEPPTSRARPLEPLSAIPDEGLRPSTPLQLPPAPEPPVLTLEPSDNDDESGLHYCDSPEQLAHADDDELDNDGRGFYCLPNIHITPDDDGTSVRRPVPVRRSAGDDGPRSVSSDSSRSDDVEFILHNQVVPRGFLAPERDGRRTPDAFSVNNLLAALPSCPKSGPPNHTPSL